MPKTSRTAATADEIADMASRGQDVSAYFTNQFTVVRPVRRVNVDLTEGMLRELDARAARLNISRQAVIKTLLALALNDKVEGLATAARTHYFVPTRAQRIAAIRHVVYEYANLVAAGRYSMYGDAPWRTHCDDAFLLGCRKLDDFLMQQRRQLDDILALDYLPPNSTPNWDLPIWITEWRAPMNKQLAHIAYSRDKEWDHRKWVPPLQQEFRKAWRDFRDAIVDNEFKREFDKQLAARGVSER